MTAMSSRSRANHPDMCPTLSRQPLADRKRLQPDKKCTQPSKGRVQCPRFHLHSLTRVSLLHCPLTVDYGRPLPPTVQGRGPGAHFVAASHRHACTLRGSLRVGGSPTSLPKCRTLGRYRVVQPPSRR